MTGDVETGTDNGAVNEQVGPVMRAVAHPNIALVKYWGKRDEAWMLPVTESLSLTIDIHATTTSVVLTSSSSDSVVLNGLPGTDTETARVARFLDIVRDWSGRSEHVSVYSVNSGPTAAGLASSAAGFAALAVAASAAYGLELEARALSRLARRGSGSACRSIFGGFAVWRVGTGDGVVGDASSFAEPVQSGPMQPALVMAIVNGGPKQLPSREAMRQTMRTSPLYPPWADTCAADTALMLRAIAAGDLAEVGSIAEQNALGMHATMLAARPAIRYLSPASMTVLDRVAQLRTAGIAAYATIDAGPNVAVWCAAEQVARIESALNELDDVIDTRVARPGPGAQLVAGGES